jgi:hypothetical protein
VRASGCICRRRHQDAFDQLILINMMGHFTQVLRGDACARGARIAARGRASRQHGVLEVFSLTGKLLATYPISEGPSQIVLDQFVSGTYLARLTTKSGDVSTRKFVVVK